MCSGEDLETTLLRYARLCNSPLPQAALKARSPLQAVTDWHKSHPHLFVRPPRNLPGWNGLKNRLILLAIRQKMSRDCRRQRRAVLAMTGRKETVMTALLAARPMIPAGRCEGKSGQEISLGHGLQEVTAKLHVRTLGRKPMARNRTHAAMIARDKNATRTRSSRWFR